MKRMPEALLPVRKAIAAATGAQAIGALGLGGVAAGAFALGALAIGALSIGRLFVGRARIRRLEIDELVVHRLRVIEDVVTPPEAAHGDVEAAEGAQPPGAEGWRVSDGVHS